ncbi:hypothetical protein C1Y40_01125 [Mycobacterium talmoniae]|uniref:Uncharacterized protein n=1 Tax=Mycobacterium talmoniae TaxID=1858794 RepID=A0A2S8BPQ8_9MYCO|nr:hypothetical protein C1Y40_01125 [Mycobacterium talmoniae]
MSVKPILSKKSKSSWYSGKSPVSGYDGCGNRPSKYFCRSSNHVGGCEDDDSVVSAFMIVGAAVLSGAADSVVVATPS